jgi:hypothetical protein
MVRVEVVPAALSRSIQQGGQIPTDLIELGLPCLPRVLDALDVPIRKRILTAQSPAPSIIYSVEQAKGLLERRNASEFRTPIPAPTA